MQKELLLEEFEYLKRATLLLKASIKKYRGYKTGVIYTPTQLEYYDSLSFRFEKCIELALNFFRALEIYLYSQTSDTLRDRLLIIQKLKLIDNIDFWMEARLLRNKIAHCYLPEELKDIYSEISKRSKMFFKYIKLVDGFIKKTDRQLVLD